LDLDRRYRLVLHSTDYIESEILDEAVPDAKAKFAGIEEEVAELLRQYPRLFIGLERRFRESALSRPLGRRTGICDESIALSVY
jgi:hypothetical protein